MSSITTEEKMDFDRPYHTLFGTRRFEEYDLRLFKFVWNVMHVYMGFS